jgi:hypothetical protein
MSLRDILIKEKPSAVIFLSTRAFAHQALNRYALSLGIPTCHLYHGLVNVQAVDLGDKAYRVNWRSQLPIVLQRSAKNITKILPTYIKALIATRAGATHWKRLAKEIVCKARARIYEEAPPDCQTTIGCVYTKADVRHMARVYKVPEDRIYVVGNPDLSLFKLGSDDMGYRLSYRDSVSREVMYIDTALIEAGMVFDGKDDFVGHLVMTKETLEASGFKLVAKLHPGHFRTGVLYEAEKRNIEVCDKELFVTRLKRCCAAIVEPSTVAMIPAVMGLPLLLANYGKLKEQKYGHVLTTYPKAMPLTDVSLLPELVAKIERTSDEKAVWDWINENSGPLPAEDMPERVAEAIDKVITREEELRFSIETRTEISVMRKHREYNRISL